MWDTSVLLSLTYYQKGERRPPVIATVCSSVCFHGVSGVLEHGPLSLSVPLPACG